MFMFMIKNFPHHWQGLYQMCIGIGRYNPLIYPLTLPSTMSNRDRVSIFSSTWMSFENTWCLLYFCLSQKLLFFPAFMSANSLSVHLTSVKWSTKTKKATSVRAHGQKLYDEILIKRGPLECVWKADERFLITWKELFLIMNWIC